MGGPAWPCGSHIPQLGYLSMDAMETWRLRIIAAQRPAAYIVWIRPSHPTTTYGRLQSNGTVLSYSDLLYAVSACKSISFVSANHAGPDKDSISAALGRCSGVMPWHLCTEGHGRGTATPIPCPAARHFSVQQPSAVASRRVVLPEACHPHSARPPPVCTRHVPPPQAGRVQVGNGEICACQHKVCGV